jgi:hypothetical protein
MAKILRGWQAGASTSYSSRDKYNKVRTDKGGAIKSKKQGSTFER